MFEVYDYSIKKIITIFGSFLLIFFHVSFTFSGVFRNSLVIPISLVMPSVMCHPYDSTLSL